VSSFLTSQVFGGIRLVKKTIEKGQRTGEGLFEFQDLADHVQIHVQRWVDAATCSREQSRELEVLLTQLDPRSDRNRGRDTKSGAQLRQFLAGITRDVDGSLRQMLSCGNEIKKNAEDIATGAQQQSEVVSKATMYVEQMSDNIDAVSHNASGAHRAALSAKDSAAEAMEEIVRLREGMERIRAHVLANEGKLRALGEHSQEIGSIVEMIGEISSRTDMLALNASIESVRAGEHGRGFAVVAEEVRKLAEQAAQAAREVTERVESIQLETQESIADMAEERAKVDQEIRHVTTAGDTLSRIRDISAESAAHMGKISENTQQQLRLTHDVVVAVEQVSDVAKANRTRAEEASWKTKTLSQSVDQLDEVLEPLRRCAQAGRSRGVTGSAEGRNAARPPLPGLSEGSTDNRETLVQVG
jgi:methyl-accepting chemotaxis protein